MVIVAIFALRVWIIPNTNDSSAIATQLVDAVDPVTQVPDFSAINDITEKKKAFFDFPDNLGLKSTIETIELHIKNEHQHTFSNSN